MISLESIKSARKRRGWTQEQLANAIGVKRSVISKYESGSISPSIDTIQKIADALEISIFDLYSVSSGDLAKYSHQEGFIESQNELREFGYCFSENEIEIVKKFNQLNDDGQQKAVERVEELTEIPRYRSDNPPGDEK